MMAGGISHIFKIIVLSTGTYAFLGSYGGGIVSFLVAGKGQFKLHHTGIGEQKGGIIPGHKG